MLVLNQFLEVRATLLVFQVAKSNLEEHIRLYRLKQDCLTMPPWGNSC